MLKKKWKQFNKLTGECYLNMIQPGTTSDCWKQTFELLRENILEERTQDPDFASELELIDDVTDYQFDIQGWLEDCMDELDMRRDHAVLLKMCDDLLELFRWPEYTGSDIRFRKSSALLNLGRTKEAVGFCEKWLEREPENIVAATAKVYALSAAQKYEEAENLINEFLLDKTQCDDENIILFTAASELYKKTGNKKAKKEMDQVLEQYDECLEQELLSCDFDEECDEDFDEDEWPFD